MSLRPMSLFGTRHKKTCLRGFVNKKGADQPAHPRSLISAFVIHFLESNIFNLAKDEFSHFYLVSVAEETGLKLVLMETPKTGFLVTRPILYYFYITDLSTACLFCPGSLLVCSIVTVSFHLSVIIQQLKHKTL